MGELAESAIEIDVEGELCYLSNYCSNTVIERRLVAEVRTK